MKDTPEGQTHWPTCWKDHHLCAVDRIATVKTMLKNCLTLDDEGFEHNKLFKKAMSGLLDILEPGRVEKDDDQ